MCLQCFSELVRGVDPCQGNTSPVSLMANSVGVNSHGFDDSMKLSPQLIRAHGAVASIL